MKITDKHGQQWQLVPVEPDENMQEAGAKIRLKRVLDACEDYKNGVERQGRGIQPAFEEELKAAISAAPEPDLTEGWEPVEFLLDGTRLKLSFREVECQNCGHSTNDFVCHPLDQYHEVLEGQWVALVPAENGRHLSTLQSTALTLLAEKERELDALKSALAEAQANDRTAMSYLNRVRAVVGGDDFPDMCDRVERWLKGGVQ